MELMYGELYLTVSRKPNELVDLITKSRTVLSSFAKAKTAKLGNKFKLAVTYCGTMLKYLISSAATIGPFHWYPEHHRHPNRSHKILYRMGHLGTSEFPSPKSRNPPCDSLHGKAIIL